MSGRISRGCGVSGVAKGGVRFAGWAAAWLLAWAVLPGTAVADRPATIRLLPKETLAFGSVADAKTLVERFNATNFGRMLQEPQIRPLFEQLYGNLRGEMAGLEDRLGVTLDEMLALPSGELAVALFKPADGPISVVGFIEVKDQYATAKKLLDQLDAELVAQGLQFREERVGDTRITVYQFRRQQLAYFDRDGVLVVGSHVSALQEVLAAWDRAPEECLADNRSYATIRSKSLGSKDEPPQVTWYVDPLGLVKAIVPAEGANAFALALLRPLGVEGIRAAGGSLTMATDKFDFIGQVHLLLAEPREGVLDLFAFTGGSTTPESWVPADAASYTTLNYDFKETYDRLKSLVDGFTGEGTTRSQAQSLFNRLGINLEEDLLPELDNRVSMASFVQRPVTLNSQATLVGLRIKDGARFRKLLERVAEQFPDNLESDSYAAVKYYRITGLNRPRRLLAQQENMPQPTPALAVVGNELLFSDRAEALEKAIASSRIQGAKLGDAIDFKLITSQAESLAGEGRMCMLSFNRPEEGFRMMYDLATAEQNRDLLSRGAENNRGLRYVDQALRDNPLPSFESLRKYMAPAGAVLIDDNTGLHYISFTLRRDSKGN